MTKHHLISVKYLLLNWIAEFLKQEEIDYELLSGFLFWVEFLKDQFWVVSFVIYRSAILRMALYPKLYVCKFFNPIPVEG